MRFPNVLDKLEENSKINKLKFSQDKCKVLHFRRANKMSRYNGGRAGRPAVLKGSLGLTVRQEHDAVPKKADCILGAVRGVSRVRHERDSFQWVWRGEATAGVRRSRRGTALGQAGTGRGEASRRQQEGRKLEREL